ncbi:MAG TPA: hypothetical protein VL793_03570, partial [Patescibacteria group bacterium]|nr:hypothetical protein [Patescibacteria group bacterium]
LAELINTHSNSTLVAAEAFGDRIELQSLDFAAPGSNTSLSATSDLSSAVFFNSARTNFLDTQAVGYLGVMVTNPTVPGDWLALQVIKTNGSQVSVTVTNTGTTNIADVCQTLLNLINASSDLTGSDGILGGELYRDVDLAQFFLFARSPGWAAAKVRVSLQVSSNLVVLPAGTNTLEDNISDLRPRNHLYLSSGLNRILIPLTLDTIQIPDGFHELELVAYEGTSVRTQTRISRMVQVRNVGLSADLFTAVAGTNITLDTPTTFLVSANTNNISTIQLFSTGGLIGTASNVSSAEFSVPTGFLGVGLHPFYAVVTDTDGNRFRTQIEALRIIPPFALSIGGTPLTLSWPSMPGVDYDILVSANLADPFQKIAGLTASGSTSQWVISPSSKQAFYRVRLTPQP